MANARKDDNSYPAWIGLSYIDGITPIRIKVNPHNGAMIVDKTHTISFTPKPVAGTDANHVHTIVGVSFDDQNMIVPLYVDPVTGGVLIEE